MFSFRLDFGQDCATEGQGRAMQARYGNGLAFTRLSPADLKPISVLPQCLDNQWVPGKMLRALKTDRNSRTKNLFLRLFGKRRVDVQNLELSALEYAVRSEYIRSLISTEQIIINRAFILNSSFIWGDFSEESSKRTSFYNLINSGTIIPYFYNEADPLSNLTETTSTSPSAYGFSVSAEGAAAWRLLCENAELQCLRLSWDDAENDEMTRQNLRRRFYTRVNALASGDAARFLQDLRGLEAARPLEEETKAFRKHLKDIERFNIETYSKHDQFPSRDDLYGKFVTADGHRTVDRLYDASKPFFMESKQLIDLVYNTNLAASLSNVLTLTPSDSPTRLALQEDQRLAKKHKEVDPSTIYMIMKDLRFALAQQMVTFIDFGQLSIDDVVAIRATQEWRAYREALERFITNEDLFDSVENFISERNGLRAFQSAYQDLLRVISARCVHAVAEKAHLEFAVRLIIQAGAEFVIATWVRGAAPIVRHGAEVAARPIADAVAEMTARVAVGWFEEKASELVGAVSVELCRRRFSDAKRQFRELRERLEAADSPFVTPDDPTVDAEPATLSQFDES